MQVSKVRPGGQDAGPVEHTFTQEQLQQEFIFLQAERITGNLLAKGMITRDEYRRIMLENRRTFPSLLSKIC